MKIAVFLPPGIPESFRVYVENLSSEFISAGAAVERFPSRADLPETADVVWDPRAGGGNPPHPDLWSLPVPLVVTLHGVAPMAIPLGDYFEGLRDQLSGYLANRRKRRDWAAWQGRYAAVVTVSEFSKATITRHLPVDPAVVHVCGNAVDHTTFSRPETPQQGRYFFHLSNAEPRKNLKRIIAAHAELPPAARLPLLLKVPRRPRGRLHDGVELVERRVDDRELVALYHGAAGFVFPSLYEGFGLPILEAMACGVPVITADDNGCAEVAGDAALCVPPRSVPAIAEAMARLATDGALRQRLVAAGLAHAARFTWRDAAARHLAVFERVVAGARGKPGVAAGVTP